MSTAMYLLAGLASDLAAIVLLAYAVYFHRYHRRDLLLAYVALNVGVLAVTVLLAVPRPASGSVWACSASCRSSGWVGPDHPGGRLLLRRPRPGACQRSPDRPPAGSPPPCPAVLVAIMYAVDHHGSAPAPTGSW